MLLYLLLEHQSTNDPDMPLRILVYLVRIWERIRKDPEHERDPLPLIVPVVVSHAAAGWTAPRTFHALFEPDPSTIPGLSELIPGFTMLVEDLARFTNDDIKGLALNAFPTLALWALRDARDARALLRNLEHWVYAFVDAMRTPSGIDALGQLLRYISLVADELDLNEFRAKIREQVPEAEAAAMTIAEQMMNKGRAEGRSEGRAEGRTEGRAEVLIKLLTLKFGALSDDRRTMIETATSEALDGYVERVLMAETIDAVFAS